MTSNFKFDPIIILCGGKSKRMGMPKGLIKIDNHTLLEHQLFCLNRFASKVILVLGFNNKKYFKKIGFLKLYHNKWKKWKNLKLFVTVNKTPKLGPFSSIQAGLKHLSTNVSAFILPIDTLSPKQNVFKALQKAGQKKGKEKKLLACIPSYRKKAGHPVWISRVLMRKIETISPISPNARLDHIINKIPVAKKQYLNVFDKKVLTNINTPNPHRTANLHKEVAIQVH